MDVEKSTLSGINSNRLRFDLGENKTLSSRTNQAIDRALQILNYCFNGYSLWLRVILWGDDEERNIIKSGFYKNAAQTYFKHVGDEDVLYMELKEYSDLLVKPLVESVVNYEMAQEPSANITCYYVNFKIPMIINIYDDRGLDVVSSNNELMLALSNKFSNWLNK